VIVCVPVRNNGDADTVARPANPTTPPLSDEAKWRIADQIRSAQRQANERDE